MASINISEEDFVAVAGAANDAKRLGHDKAAAQLDKIARKINAALSNSRVSPLIKFTGNASAPLTWRDVPSVFDVRDPG